MPTDCEIIFDENSHGTYFSGQKVSGKVVLTLDKQKPIKGIALKICGYAETNWRQKNRHGHGKERKRRTFQGRVDYLASTTYVLGSENNKHDINIEAGTHTYNFYCTIPELCPSSFESSTGHIRYVAKVIVLRSKKTDKTYSTGFTVLKRVDLNADTSVIKGPVHAEVVKMVSTGLFSKKPLILRVDIPQNGFVSGQAIMVNTQIDNQSNTPLKGIRFALNLVATFHSQIPRAETRVEKINLCKVKSAPVDKQTTVNFMEILRVPPTPPSCPDLCRIIQISYEIDVMAKIAGVHFSPSLVIPVVIGNVPLMNVSPHLNIQQTDVALQKKLEAEGVHNQKALEAANSMAAVSLDPTAPSTSAQAIASTSSAASSSVAPEAVISTAPPSQPDPVYDGLPPSYDEAMAMSGPIIPITANDDDSDSEIEVIENDGDDDGDDEEVEVADRAIEPIYPVLEMGILVDLDDSKKETKSDCEKK